jgi:nucleoside-diphosphate-sugar epimerase
MRIVVTGGAGQLGTVALRRLAADREVESIVCVDLRPPMIASRKIEIVQADIRSAQMRQAMSGADALLHFAFLVTQAAPRDEIWGVNVGGTENVVRAAIDAGVKRIVYSSSIAAYGCVTGHALPLVESSPRVRQDAFAYAATKYDVEELLDIVEAQHPDVAIARLRPAILLGERIEHVGGLGMDRRILLDFHTPPPPVVWDEDVADAAVLAMRKSSRGAFNLSAEESLSVPDLAREADFRVLSVPRVVARSGVSAGGWLARAGVRPPFDPAWLSLIDVPLAASSERARRELGWKPRFPTAADVGRRLGQVARGSTDPRIAAFMRLLAIGARRVPPAPEAARVEAMVHMCLTGRGGGDWSLRVSAGRLSVRSGVPRPPTSTVTLAASTFLDMLSGRTSAATAQLTGKIRVEGEPIANMVLVGMITRFLALADAPGAVGWVARRMSELMAPASGRAS